MIDIGVQLYTVRNLLSKREEISLTMKKIKEIGYGSVQLCGKLDFAQSCAEEATKNGLFVSGYLSDIDTLTNSPDEVVNLCKTYAISDVGVSSAITDYDILMEFISQVNEISKIFKEHGITFSYHNHAKEFIKIYNNKTVMEILLEHFDPESVNFMPDTYWLQYGGFDVRYFLELTKGRATILHLKDMKFTMDGPTFAEVGSGNLYMEGIIQTALNVGISRFVVEQDKCDKDPLESIKESFEYLRRTTLCI